MGQLTPTMIRSLEILADNEPLMPSEFANLFFPRNHPGWTRSCKCGAYGSTTGSGLVMWAGGWLGKLRKKGLVQRHHDRARRYDSFVLTEEGYRTINRPQPVVPGYKDVHFEEDDGCYLLHYTPLGVFGKPQKTLLDAETLNDAVFEASSLLDCQLYEASKIEIV